MLERVKGLLTNVQLYVGLQKAVGADRLRYRCLDALQLTDDDTVLDIGCGPAYYFGRLPAVRYFGFDTEPRYIEHARKRFGSERAEFRCEVFTKEHVEKLPPVNAVMLLGLLHHLSEDDCHTLLDLAGSALAPGGRVISVDTCFEPTQGRISRWMSSNDRGEHVREPAGFCAIAEKHFDKVDGEVLGDVTRVPSSHWMMVMASPKAAVVSEESVASATTGAQS